MGFKPINAAEKNLHEQLNGLFEIRRQFLKTSTDRQQVQTDGNKAYRKFVRDFRASLKVKRGKATKV